MLVSTRNVVEYYYRQPTSPPSTVAAGTWQEGSAIGSVEEMARRIEQLTAQGYVVDAAKIADVCPTCGAQGTLPVRPKGMRATTFDHLVSTARWTLPAATCETCQGRGYTTEHVYHFTPESRTA